MLLKMGVLLVSSYLFELSYGLHNSNDLVKEVELLMQKETEVLNEMGANAFNFATENLQISIQVNKLLSALNNV